MGQFARQAEDGRQVDLEHGIPVVVGHAHEEAVLGDAGIVDEDVDAFELGFGPLPERLDLVAVRQVGREELHAVAQFAGQRLELLDAGAMQADDGALRVQRAGDRFADAAGSTGHQGLPAGQIKHGLSFRECRMPRSGSSAPQRGVDVGRRVRPPIAERLRSMRRARPVSTLPAPIS